MRQPASYTTAAQRSLVPLLIIGCSIVLFTFFYAQPFQSWQNIDALYTRATGLYPAEQNDQYRYAFTQGKTVLTIPVTGQGWFATSLRMAGPERTVPVSASVVSERYAVGLGKIDEERVIHVLLPSTERETVRLDLLSTTTQVANDSRELGVLINWVSVESLGSTVPPTSSLLLFGGILGIIWVGAVQLPFSALWRHVLLVCIGGSLSVGLGLYRLHQWPLSRDILWGSVLFTTVIMLRHVPLSRIWPSLSSNAHRYGRSSRSYLESLRRYEHSRFVTALRVVTPLFIVWRLALWAVAAVGLWFSQHVYIMGTSHDAWHRGELIDGSAMWAAGGAARLNFLRKVLLDTWLQWDGHRYVWIAIRAAYEYNVIQPNIAFFPLYPLLTRGMMFLTGGDASLAAMLVSQIALYAGLLLLYDLVATDFNPALGRRTLLCLLLFPTAVFLGAIYTESLAIALGVAAVWAMRRERWWLAGIAGFFLALCRLPGVLIAPVIALSYLHHHQWQWRTMFRPALVSSLLPPLGLGVFMGYQWYVFGTPFAFLLAQKDWDNRTSPPWVLPLSIIRAFGNTQNLPLEILQLATWIGFIGLAFLAVRWLPLPYTLTMLFLLVPPYLSSWHRSFSRYVLPAFPAFIVIAMLCERRSLRNVLLVATLPFFVGGIVLFVNSFWLG